MSRMGASLTVASRPSDGRSTLMNNTVSRAGGLLDLIKRCTNTSVSPDRVSVAVVFFSKLNRTSILDLAIIGKKVVDFYKKRGIPVISPLEKAIHL